MSFTAQIIDRETRKIIATSEPFAEPLEAWAWLRDERRRDEDKYPNNVGEYSQTFKDLDYVASGDHPFGNPNDDWGYSGITGWGTRHNGTGIIPGDTPAKMNSHGETPDDDFGLDYVVELGP